MHENCRLPLLTCLGLSVTFAACTPRWDTTSPAGRSSLEGRTCPRELGSIADGESNSNQIADVQGRGGYWYTFLDDAGSSIVPEAGKNGGTFQMSPGGAGGSRFAAHMSGTLGTGGTVYAGMGLNFVEPKGVYDASKYKGVSFWARKGPGSTGNVRLKMPDNQTDPEGKVCKECFNDFGADLALTEEWREFTIPFSRMKQLKDWGSRFGGIHPDQVYGMQWQVNEPGANFDIWVDDIAFTGCEG